MSIFEARLDEDEQRLYTLEAVVGDAPEASPQSSLRSGIDNLGTRFSNLSDQLNSLQERLEAGDNTLLQLSHQLDSHRSSFATLQDPSQALGGELFCLRNDMETFRCSLLEVISLVQQVTRRHYPPSEPSSLDQRFTPLTIFHS